MLRNAKPKPRPTFRIPNPPQGMVKKPNVVAPTGQMPQQYRSNKPDRSQPAYTTDPRKILSVISTAAKQNLIIIIRYVKKTADNQVITRAVEPYSLRLRQTKSGAKVRYFYGFCANGPTLGIHSFILNNIKSVQITNQRYTPRWVVEL